MMRRIHGIPVGSTVLAAIVLTVAVVAHAGLWYFMAQHLRLSGAVASVLIALAVLKHLGWIGGAYALLRKRRAPEK